MIYCGALHNSHGVYPLFLTSCRLICILLFLKLLHPSLWYLLPVFVIYTVVDWLSVGGTGVGVGAGDSCGAVFICQEWKWGDIYGITINKITVL